MSEKCGESASIIPLGATVRVGEGDQTSDIGYNKVSQESQEGTQLLEFRPWILSVDRGAPGPITGPYPSPAAGPVAALIGSLRRRVVLLGETSINVINAMLIRSLHQLHRGVISGVSLVLLSRHSLLLSIFSIAYIRARNEASSIQR